MVKLKRHNMSFQKLGKILELWKSIEIFRILYENNENHENIKISSEDNENC